MSELAGGLVAGMNELLRFTSEDLYAELRRRGTANRNGKCDACGAWYDSPACGSKRHCDAGEDWIGRWALNTGSTWLSASIDRPDGARVSVNRYGSAVRLFRASDGCVRTLSCAQTELPDTNVSDRERFEWAIKWADAQLLALDSEESQL